MNLKILLAGVTVACAGVAAAATIYVSPTGNDETGDGSRGNPYASPAKGVSSASRDGDEVVLLKGTYLTDKRVAWNAKIKVRGETSDRRETVIDFGGTSVGDCAVAFTGGSIHDLTISNATTTGLWLKNNADAYASNVVVTCCSQSGSRAGGVQLDAGSLIDCLITRNVSKNSCGGVKMAAGTLVSGCQVTYNDVGEEGFGGIGAPMDAKSPIIVKDTLIAYNRARYAAGVGDVTVIDNCDILCNSSGVSRCNGTYTSTAGSLGTAVLVRNSALDACISNSVIRGNVSGGTGGGQGIYNNGVRLTVVDTDLI